MGSFHPSLVSCWFRRVPLCSRSLSCFPSLEDQRSRLGNRRSAVKVRWEDLSPDLYEKMVAVLLSRLHPDSQRIDGSGGDGGKDVQIKDQGRLTRIFELKSFTGRVDSSRRTQVKNSLKRASEWSHPQWSLVVPIDPTPGELEWFEELAVDHTFPIKWLGKTWLDDKMAAHEDVRRYFCEEKEHEVVNLLLELQREEAKVTNAVVAVERLSTLHQRLNQIDPFYRYELTTGVRGKSKREPEALMSVTLNDTQVDVYEKYFGSARDRPITGKFEIEFDVKDTALIRGFEDALDYGTPVTLQGEAIKEITLDAPAGLGGSFSGGYLSIHSSVEKLDDPIHLQLNVVDGDNVLVSWPVQVTHRTDGIKGTIFDASDVTGWLTVQIKANFSTQHFQATFKLEPKPIMPAALLPLLHWVIACRSPARMTIVWPGGLEMSSAIAWEPMDDERFVAVVEALAYLQQRSGVYFHLPPEISLTDEKIILDSAALARGSKLDTGGVTLHLREWPTELDPILRGEGISLLLESEESISFDQDTLPLGKIRIEMEAAIARDPGSLRNALNAGTVPDLKLIPRANSRAEKTLIAPPAGARGV